MPVPAQKKLLAIMAILAEAKLFELLDQMVDGIAALIAERTESGALHRAAC
jgi:hypothetical protein